jgi:hypothetical protein
MIFENTQDLRSNWISYYTVVLPLFPFVGRFGISRFTFFVMCLNKYLSRYIITTMNVDLPKRPKIWNGILIFSIALPNSLLNDYLAFKI